MYFLLRATEIVSLLFFIVFSRVFVKFCPESTSTINFFPKVSFINGAQFSLMIFVFNGACSFTKCHLRMLIVLKNLSLLI